MVDQTFLRQRGHIHLHYPSGNPHDDQAVHVDIGADAGGDLKYSGYREKDAGAIHGELWLTFATTDQARTLLKTW
jgi:hypothetical protein